MNEAIRCKGCGQAIGAYEPIGVFDRGGSRRTSLARERELAGAAESVFVHDACAQAFASTVNAG